MSHIQDILNSIAALKNSLRREYLLEIQRIVDKHNVELSVTCTRTTPIPGWVWRNVGQLEWEFPVAGWNEDGGTKWSHPIFIELAIIDDAVSNYLEAPEMGLEFSPKKP